MASPVKTASISKKSTPGPGAIRLMLSILFVMFLQFVLCSQFSSRVFRVDILLVAPIYLALSIPLFVALIASCILGFMMDVLSGSFIGFHLFFYVVISIFVAILEQQVNLGNIIQQLIVLLVAWVIDTGLLQLFSLVDRSKGCGFCYLSKLFILKTATIVGLGALVLLLMPVISGFRIRKGAK